MTSKKLELQLKLETLQDLRYKLVSALGVNLMDKRINHELINIIFDQPHVREDIVKANWSENHLDKVRPLLQQIDAIEHSIQKE